jgi:hypothetical protein
MKLHYTGLIHHETQSLADKHMMGCLGCIVHRFFFLYLFLSFFLREYFSLSPALHRRGGLSSSGALCLGVHSLVSCRSCTMEVVTADSSAIRQQLD